MKNISTKFYTFFIIKFFILSAVFWVIKKSLHFFEMALNRKNTNTFLDAIEKTKEFKILKSSENAIAEEINVFLEHSKKEIYCTRSIHKDNIKLYGDAYLQEKYTKKWVIVVHGYSGTCEQMVSTVMNFYNKGFNVLSPDCRGHGRSEGDYISMGWHDRLDILSWANKLVEKDSNCEIVLYGLSMGGAAVLMASGEEMPKNIKCIIEDSGYTSVREQFAYHLKNKYKLPKFPILYLADTICRFKVGFNFKEASAINQVKKCKIPILFIHGQLDTLVPVNMAYRLFEETKCNKEILIIPEAGHGVCACIGGDMYWNKIYLFISKYI